jgi:hypothetical protein
MSEWRDEMFAKLAEQKKEFIDAHISTYSEYPKCYMHELDFDTILAVRKMLESRVIRLHNDLRAYPEKEDPMHILLQGKQSALFDLMEHLDEFVEHQVSKAEDQLGEPMSY